MKRSTWRRGTRMIYRWTGLNGIDGETVAGACRATKRFIGANNLRKVGAGERVLIRSLDDEGRYIPDVLRLEHEQGRYFPNG